jgi:membrane associated rhomboid family serine protease
VSQADRDWYRDEGASRRAFAWSGTPVTWTLLGALVAAWLVVEGSSQHDGPRGAAGDLLAWAALSADGVLRAGRLWQPVTWFWLHEPGAVRALLSSLVLLFAFGRHAERHLGARAALATFVAGGIASGLVALPWLTFVSGDRSIVDASGATFALSAATARRLHGERWLGGLPARGLIAAVLALRTADLLFVDGGLAYAPVVVGAAVGWVAAGLGLRPKRGPVAPRGRPPAVAAEEAEGRARLDALLQKIHDAGMPSLTAEERRFLEEASRRYRDPRADSR